VNAITNAGILSRGEAVQMVTDLNTVIDKIISIAADAPDLDKVVALEALAIVKCKRDILEGEIAEADREAAKGGGK
jgi:hypothetical protein